MSAQTLEHQDLHQAIDTLTDAALKKLAHYVDFLRYEERMDELEEADDIAYINAHRDDPTEPFDIKDFE